jgi:hypothetical protein
VDHDVQAFIPWNGSWLIGGNFSHVDGIEAHGIACWDGSSWSAMDAGLHPASAGYVGVHAFAVWNGTLIAAGNFYVEDWTTCNIAQWNGTSWVHIGSGIGPPDDYVYSLVVHNGQLYAGGLFAGYIRMVGGTAPGGGTDDEVYSLASWNGLLIAAGYFHNAGGVSCAHIAQWDGSSWAPLGPGVEGTSIASVWALAAPSETELYVGGRFTHAGTVPAKNIARWDGSIWSGLGSGTNLMVWALAAQPEDILVGGEFLSAGGISVNHVARYSEAGWSAMGDGVPFVTYAFGAGLGDTLAGGHQALSRWDGSQWGPIDHTTSVRNEPGQTPIVQVFPNPSHGGVRVDFVPVTSGSVHLGIFDAAGRVVFSRFGSVSCNRPCQLVWDGTGLSGLPVSAGSYWVRLSGDSGNAVHHVIVVR